MITFDDMLENGIPYTIPCASELNTLLIEINDIPSSRFTNETKIYYQKKILELANSYTTHSEIIYYKRVSLLLSETYRFLLNLVSSELVNLTGLKLLDCFEKLRYSQKVELNRKARRLGAQNANKTRSIPKNRCFDIFKSLPIEQQKSRNILHILFDSYEQKYKEKLNKENYLVKRWVREWKIELLLV